MSEPTSPVITDADALTTTPRLGAAELPDASAEVPVPKAAKKRDRESALGSGAVTPNSSEDAKGFSLTPVAKKGRVQDVSSSPRQLRDPLQDETSKADIEEDVAEASPSPPETPPGQQLSISPSAAGNLPSVTVPETGRVANIRQKVQRMSTGDGEDFADDETASNASSSKHMLDHQPPLSAVRDERSVTATSSTEAVDEDSMSIRGPSPLPTADLRAAEPDKGLAPPITAATSELPATLSPTKPVSSFASFSKSASPFAAVPSSSRPSFGGAKLSSAGFSKPLPLSKPNVQALVNSTASEVGPPSPASSIRAEINSIPPVSRQSSFSGSARADSVDPEPVATAEPATEPSEGKEELVEAAASITALPGSEAPPPTAATGLESLPQVTGPAAAPSTSAFAARFAGSTSAFGKAKTTPATGSSAFGSFSSSATSPFGSVRKSPYPPGGRRPSQEASSPEREKTDKSFGDLLKEDSETGINGDDAVPKMLFTEQEVITGEEDEELLHSVRGKLYVMEAGSWRERGLGQLRLNAKLGGAQPRLVMRADATHRLLLNAALFPGFQIKASDRQVQFGTVEDGAFTSWALKVSNAQASTATVSAVQSALFSLTPPGDGEVGPAV